MNIEKEADAESRFEFGENWTNFLSVLDDERIESAVDSLKDLLVVDDLSGCRFLDIGSGSGLFSLAARRLGARVVSFDFDPRSVACTTELKLRYFADDENWSILQGSALDRDFIEHLGTFDVVYSWGVLHHTGAMWIGFENAISCVAKPGGKLCIAIYNDQGWKSRVWWLIKRLYVRLPRILQASYILLISAIVRIIVTFKNLVRLQPRAAMAPFFRDESKRGMSYKFDKVDWIGGFPYEFSNIDTLISYFNLRGFAAIKTYEKNSQGCHELTFERKQ